MNGTARCLWAEGEQMFGHQDNNDNQQLDEINTDAATAPLPPAPVAAVSFGTSNAADRSNAGDADDSVGLDSEPALHSTAQAGSTATDDLLDIKQQALQQLTPLVSHLDQTPEEKFRTTMMMIQGSDNQSLIKDAYAAAQAIADEKARAQALLDIVNEINYFTQHAATN